MKKISTAFLLIFYVITGCAQPTDKNEKQVGGSCEACDLMFIGIPPNLSWQTSLTETKEPGEPMIISGRVFKQDGTPATDVILYMYQTNSKGSYSPSLGQIRALRHGHIRGWMKTDGQGRYEFKTIRPGAYPDSTIPQHIHPIIKEQGLSFYWIDDFVFEDDPLLTVKERKRLENRGGSGIITLIKSRDGVWEGKRDIILGKNIPNY